MKKYYPWLALVVALTLNTPGEPATAEYNAVKTSDGEEVVEPGQKSSENRIQGKSGIPMQAVGNWAVQMAVTTNKSTDGSTANALIIEPVLNMSRVPENGHSLKHT